MYRPLKKPLLIIALSIVQLTSYAQFPFDVSIGAKPKGKIDSVITEQHFGGTKIEVYNIKGQLVKFYLTPYIEHNTHNGLVRDTIDITYTYHADGRLKASSEVYRGDKKHTALITYQYLKTDTGTIIKTPLRAGQLYQLDRYGKIILSKGYPVAGLSDDMRYVYNSKAEVIKIIMTNATYKRKADVFYEYDDNGNIKKLIRNSGKVVFTFDYVNYDNHGNWLTQNAYNDGELIDTYPRRITYHK